MTERPTVGRLTRATLLVAGAAALLHAVVEFSNVIGESGPRRQAVAVVLSAAAMLAIFAAMRAVARDVRTFHKLLDDLRASEKQAAGITSLAVDAIITIDEGQRIIVFNHGAETTFGWSARDIVGQPLSVLLPERLRAVHAEHIHDFGRGTEVARRMGERQTIAGLRRDGTEFPAEASISRLDLPKGRLYTVVLRDVTERQRQLQDERFLAGAGATLGASLDYESTLVSAVHLPVPHLADCCVLDLLAANGMTRRIASVHDDPERTRALRALEHRQEVPGDWPFPVARALEAGAPVTMDAGALDSSGGNGDARRPAVATLGMTAVTSLPLEARGHHIGVLTLINTETRPNADDRLKVAESVGKLIALAIENASLYQAAQRATVARDEVLGAVSHDLRNPLAAISLCAHALKAGTSGDRDEIIAAIIESAGMMNRMIQDLLDVATIDSGHLRLDPSAQHIDALLDRVLAMTKGAAQDREVAVQGALPNALPSVMVDSTRFVQVLANLVGNAVKFTEPGGTVNITAQAKADEVVIAVKDTGVGIPPDHLPHIFDRHWHARRTARTMGTGLGLAIARGIVEAQGGRIWVDSTEGVGSTFSFTVPIAPEPAPVSDPVP